ncbi:MAG: aspartate aminotransferase family protein [Chloroflexi bacterium]|nr:aspartate aminotransferase family protein [Chloroflexota bacterium]
MTTTIDRSGASHPDEPGHAPLLDDTLLDPDLIARQILDFRQMSAFAEDPFIFVGGDGVTLTDHRGNTYLDGLSGVFVASIGHRHPRVVQAIQEQLDHLAFAPPLHGTNPPALALARELLSFADEALPGQYGAVKLLSGGSEANEAALKLARQYWQQAGHPRKFKVLARYGGYHGATMGALSATGGWERKSVFEPLVAGFLHVHPPACQRCPFDHTLSECRAHDLFTCARHVERTIEAEDPETVAAVIMEPISVSSAGFTVPPVEYFQMLRATCDKHKVLLIFDEIITGFGRLGTRFGAEYYGVAPDLITCGKGMSGGYSPLAAVLIAEHVRQAFLGEPGQRREFHHGHTFGGNPLSSAAGLAVLRLIRQERLVERAAEVGQTVLRARLDQLAATLPGLRNVRGVGLLQGLDLDPSVYGPTPGPRLEHLCKERGLIARIGRDFLCFAPPLTTPEASLHQMVDIVEESLTALRASVG